MVLAPRRPCIGPSAAKPHLEIETADVDGTVVIRVRGELDLATVDLLQREIDQTFTASSPHLILDCRELTFVDSTGMSLMLMVHREVGRDGTRFAVVPGDGAVRTLLGLTGLDQHLTMVDDPDDIFRAR